MQSHHSRAQRHEMKTFRRLDGLRRACVGAWMLLGFALATQAQSPVSNVTVSMVPQELGKVQVTYDLSNGGSLNVSSWAVGLAVSSNGGASFLPVDSVSGAVGSDQTPGTGRVLIWNALLDWPRQVSNQMRVRVKAWDKRLSGSPFVPVPSGNFVIGNQSNDADFGADAPVTPVGVSGFFIQTGHVTKALWDQVVAGMSSKGYAGLSAGGGKGDTHPVHSVSWYEAITWANLASEREELMPCYTLSGGSVIRNPADAQANAGQIVCVWTANGYRLPTEAEWEVAARGGQVGRRFPWGGQDRISSELANYTGDTTVFSFDEGADGPNSTFDDGVRPLTSPVGSFPANGYGLFDMAGNVSQWCWDAYGPSYLGGADPRGPAGGTQATQPRVVRGGNWEQTAGNARCARREKADATSKVDTIGFRVVRGRP
jgi:sulfatase modifying factor 1